MDRCSSRTGAVLAIGCAIGIASSIAPAQAAGWEPSRTVRLVVPGSAGGGADEMARVIQGIVAKHKLMGQRIEVVNKPAGAGAEAFAEIGAASGDPQVLVMGSTNLFTTPLAAGQPGWRGMTPVSMMALDRFVLWVNAESPHRTPAHLAAAAKAGEVTVAGTGAKQEDELLTAAIGKAAGGRFAYRPMAGAIDVVQALVDRTVDATVSNPSEAVQAWTDGMVRPLCVFAEARMTDTHKVTDTHAWSDIPTCKQAGLDVDYEMLRGILMPAGVTAEQRAFFDGLLARVRATGDWRETLAAGAFDPLAARGDAFALWLTAGEARHRDLMRTAGFLPAR